MIEALGVIALLCFGGLLWLFFRFVIGPVHAKYTPPSRIKRDYHAQVMHNDVYRRYDWRIVDSHNEPIKWPEEHGIRCWGTHFIKQQAEREGQRALDAIYKYDNPERWRNVE